MNKFTNTDVMVLEGTALDVFERLEGFARYLAQSNQDPDLPGTMEFDDLLGDLLLEIVKGFKRYGSLPADQQYSVIKVMLKNRLAEMRHRNYVTSRKVRKQILSLDYEPDSSDGGDYEDEAEALATDCSAEEIVESKERMRLLMQRLSPVARRVFKAVIYGDKRLTMMAVLSARRSTAIFKSSSYTLRPWHIADALMIDVESVREAMDEIKFEYHAMLAEDD